MVSSKKNFFVTTSIAYTNAPPHIGYALELVQADVIARFHRLLKETVFFLTGTDEHGQKIDRAAKEEGKSPKIFTDQLSNQYQKLTKVLNLSNDDFIRTTDKKRHWPVVERVWLNLKEKDDIYKKKYLGYYCVGCEAFIKEKDLVSGKCPIHNREPEIIEEENYFFRLSRYSKEIQKIIEKGKIRIIPESRKNEMLNFAKKGLEDISFSRPSEKLKWGIPVPDDKTQTIYVWVDALTNYISLIGYGTDEKKFKKYWPANIHCIGKDIQKFHSLIWPAMLLSLVLELPKNILVHGFINFEGRKMSKSLGNVVDPFDLVKKYGTDTVRYFLLREIPPFEDGDFSYQKFEQRYNSDLAKGLGNLVSRVITLKEKNKISFSKINPDTKLKKKISETTKNWEKYLKEFRFNEALASIWDLISFCDKYVEEEKPWVVSKKQKTIIKNLLFGLNEVAHLLIPFLPETSERILKQLKGGKSQNLFPKIY